jgi:hypothetical protein
MHLQLVNWIPPRYNSVPKLSSSSKLTKSLPAAIDDGCINRYAIDNHARPFRPVSRYGSLSSGVPPFSRVLSLVFGGEEEENEVGEDGWVRFDCD